MANLAVTYTLVDGTVGYATYWNTNYSDIVTYINNRNSGSATWDILKISSTSANALDVTSSASGSTELSINNSATDGDPELTFKLSGSQTYIIGVDDSDSDFLKFATTGITTNVAMQIPTVGAQVQFNAGTALLPSMSIIGDPNTGIYSSAADRIDITVGGTARFRVDGSGFINILSSDLYLPATNKLYLDGGNDTYIVEGAANRIQMITGGTVRFTLDSSGFLNLPSLDIYVTATNKLYLDGGGDTYINESAANVMSLVAGNTEAGRFDTSATATHTRLLVYDVDNATLERVTVGAADSGGAGFKLLRIPN